MKIFVKFILIALSILTLNAGSREEFFQRFGLWRRDEEWFSGGYGEGETEVAFRHFL